MGFSDPSLDAPRNALRVDFLYLQSPYGLEGVGIYRIPPLFLMIVANLQPPEFLVVFV